MLFVRHDAIGISPLRSLMIADRTKYKHSLRRFCHQGLQALLRAAGKLQKRFSDFRSGSQL